MENEQTKFEITKVNFIAYYQDTIKSLEINEPYRDLKDMRKALLALKEAKEYPDIQIALKHFDLIST